MKYRKLRIAFSAVCGVVCLLLIGLWVRSYWQYDWLYGRLDFEGPLDDGRWTVYSVKGKAGLQLLRHHPSAHQLRSFAYDSSPADGVDEESQFMRPGIRALGFKFVNVDSYFKLETPAWALILTMLGVAWLPWIRWRFSLRTLLIGMMVVAVLLGLIVLFANRAPTTLDDEDVGKLAN